MKNNKYCHYFNTLSFLIALSILTIAGMHQALSAQIRIPEKEAGQATHFTKVSTTQHERNILAVNEGTVGIITGDIRGSFMQIAADMAAVLDSNRAPKLRLLPIPGRGGKSNIEDLLFLRGIDLAIVQSDILEHMEQRKKYRNIRQKVRYIAKLFDSELHIITRKNISDISQLNGKKVNLRYRDSASDITGRIILNAFNVSVIPTYFDQSLALKKVSEGELDASIVVAAKPSNIYSLIPPGSNLRLLPVPFNARLGRSYLPAKFSHKDYPGLTPKGKMVPTIASSTILAVYDWPEKSSRYEKVSQFVFNFFTYINDLKKTERHAKWKTTIPSTQVPGWKRFKAAQIWIDNTHQFLNKENASRALLTLAGETSLEYGNQPARFERRRKLYRQFEAYIQSAQQREGSRPLNQGELNNLFNGFLDWKNRTAR